MAYLGNSPVLSQQEYRNIDNISGSFNGSTTSFALLVNGVAPVPAPQSSNQCLISVNGVVQKPDDTGATGFRISGGNIIFSSAPTGGQSFFGVILAGADYIYAGQNFPDGTVSAPSITFNQDLDTGFYRSGAGEIKYTANGTAVVTLSSNNLTAPSFIPTSSSAPTNGVYLPAANTVAISTNGSGRLFINSSGNVGVGIASPTTTFDVAGNARLHNSASNTNRKLEMRSTQGYSSFIQFTEDNIADRWSLGIANGDGGFIFKTGADFTGTERLRITSAGLVGVGTSSPATALDVNGTVTCGTAGGVALSLANGTAIRNSAAVANTIYFDTSFGSATHGSFEFRSSNAATTRMIIDSSGRVGIGTSTPSVGLHVSGATNTAAQIRSSNTTNSVDTVLVSETNGVLRTNTNHSLALGTNSTTALTIDTSQRVGIGTQSPASIFHISGSADQTYTFQTTTAGADNRINFRNSAGTDAGGIWYMHSGNHLLFNTGGSNGEKARIDGSGRLLVGTSSASAASSVVIQGNSTSSTGNSILRLQRGDTTLTDGQVLGGVYFGDSTGTQSVEIEARRDGGTWSASSKPTRLLFSTTADGASSPTERMRIANNGAISTVVPGGSTLYPAYDCRAWVNFNGTGVVAIRGSGNVSSITDNGTGDYTVNLTTAMPDANYSVVATTNRTSAVNGTIFNLDSGTAPTTTAVKLLTFRVGTGVVDTENNFVAIFR